jgi:DNA-binding GntR family transcriptional regulator
MMVESMVDLAGRSIQDWIVTGEFEPGRKIKEEEIAQRLGISRPPVREAFKALEAEGLIVRKPRRGVFVSEMTEKDIWEVYTLKACLYELAVGIVMEVISQDQIASLESLVDQMEQCVGAEPLDVLRYQTLHGEFHGLILRIAGNDRLERFASNLHKQVRRFSYRSLRNERHLLTSAGYHRRIIDAVKKKDSDAACRLMREHVLTALDDLLHIIREKMTA